MKGSIFLLLILLFSCEEKVKTADSQKLNKPKTETSSTIEENHILESQLWFQYYRTKNPSFQAKLFHLEETSTINYQKATISILNEKSFNKIYHPFLIFNENKNKYLDFDSYNWFLETDGSASYEADQQVVLVDLKKKTAKQIAFFGPSSWIEDAYWKGDSIAVLMGNSYEKVPFIMEYNFSKNLKKEFNYSDTLKFETSYSKIRMERKGIRVE